MATTGGGDGLNKWTDHSYICQITNGNATRIRSLLSPGTRGFWCTSFHMSIAMTGGGDGLNKRTGGWANRWIGGSTDRWMGGQVDGWKVERWVGGWVGLWARRKRASIMHCIALVFSAWWAICGGGQYGWHGDSLPRARLPSTRPLRGKDLVQAEIAFTWLDTRMLGRIGHIVRGGGCQPIAATPV